jgi:hypothetical protein
VGGKPTGEPRTRIGEKLPRERPPAAEG